MNATLENHKVVLSKTYNNEFTGIFYSNGIVELVWNESVKQITEDTLKNVKSFLYEAGEGKKLPVYVSTYDFMNMTQEAKLYASNESSQEYTLANAVLIDNLAKKIMFNFFIKFYGTKTPARAFSNKEDAFKWLIAFQNNSLFQ